VDATTAGATGASDSPIEDTPMVNADGNNCRRGDYQILNASAHQGTSNHGLKRFVW
jgi:hypothetical protein